MLTEINSPDLFAQAVAHHQAGRFAEAESLYRRILDAEPNHLLSLSHLGVIACQTGRHGEGAGLIAKAIALNDRVPDFHNNLGGAYRALGRGEEAIGCYRKALALRPDFPDACYNLGNALRERGAGEAAVSAYRAALVLKPDYAQAFNNLGNISKDQGQLAEAAVCYRRTLGVLPDFAEAWSNLGLVLTEREELDSAAVCFESALAARPDYAEAYNNFGNVRTGQGRLPEAIAYFARALALKADYAEAHNNRGNALADGGDFAGAEATYRRAMALKPDYEDAPYNLANTLHEQGRLDEAAAWHRQALGVKPDYAVAHNNLGNVLKDQGKLVEAAVCYRRARVVKPDYFEADNNLGNVLQEQGRLADAVACYHRALDRDPGFAEAHHNLGNALINQCKLDAAVASYHRALAINPDHADAYSNLLFCLNYHPDLSAPAVFAAYREWGERFAQPHLVPTEGRSRDPDRRLRIGYVSPDLRLHSARHFIEPLLAHHDKAAVETFAYAEVAVEDAFSRRFRGMTDHWLRTVGMSDEALAARIREDGIDILVDMAGHTRGNRLLVFARKPAPIQVSWLGYGYTTGLREMDYFMADAAFAPPGCEDLFTETPYRLPVFAAYTPAEGMGEPGPLPARDKGFVTFGTLTRSIRINHRVVRVWSAILRQVPGSRLELNSRNFNDPALRRDIAAQFAAHGITPDRLDLGCQSPPWDVLRRFDLSLDCFPHNSGTTLYETLYMGVPFVTLADRPSVGRMGASLLTALGRPEWIAEAEKDYIGKAVALASDIDGLAQLRAGLRAEMEASRLMDGPAYARSVEAAYREMWEKWCRGRNP